MKRESGGVIRQQQTMRKGGRVDKTYFSCQNNKKNAFLSLDKTSGAFHSVALNSKSVYIKGMVQHSDL